MTKKYPIGTKIRFLNKYFDTNKKGTIVGFDMEGRVDIYLPTATKHVSDNHHPTLKNGTPFTWHCRWEEIERIGQQQLEFDFMNE